MGRQRKTDEYKLKEGRGCGRGQNYKPWLKIHEFGSNGRAHRPLGWKVRRPYQLMSDLENEYFLILQWQDNVIDIREQYPLLPLEQTKLIADDLNIKHPKINNKKEVVMSTDFLLTIKKDNLIYDIARTIKSANDLKNARVKEKLSIEKEYWKLKNIDWGVVTDEQINKTMARNIEYIYYDYFWDEESGFSGTKIRELTNIFKSLLHNNDYNIIKTTEEFDGLMEWDKGETLNFFKFLLAKKEIVTDMTKRLNFHSMRVWF